MKSTIQNNCSIFLNNCIKNRIDLITIKNQDNYIDPLIQYFKKRKNKY